MKKSPYTNKEIADLVLRARNGEQEAFSELYKCTNDKAYYTAYSIVKNNDDAMDLLQDAYVKAFQSLDTLNNPDSFTSWLCRIVSNGCKNYLVKKKPILFSEMKREDNDEDNEEYLQIEDTRIDTPAQVLEDNDLRERIMELLENLNEDQRLCMLMVYFHGMKLSEVAEALEVSENTVKSRIFYAKKAMRKEIAQYEEEKGIPFNTIVIGPFLRSVFEESSRKVRVPKKIYGRIAKNLSFKKATVFAKMKSATLTQKVVVSVCAFAVVGASIALPFALHDYNAEITDSFSAEISVSAAGNTPLNISNGGIAVENDNYLVYIDADSVVNDGDIYALQNEKVMLVDKNSGATQELFTEHVGYLNLIGQNLYYVDLSDNGKLYCYSLEDQTNQPVSDITCTAFAVYKDTMIYTDASRTLHLYQISTQNDIAISTLADKRFQFNDEYVFFISESDQKIHCVDYNGENDVCVLEEICSNFALYENGIIYSAISAETYESTLNYYDMHENKVLATVYGDSFSEFNISGENLYYRTAKDWTLKVLNLVTLEEQPFTDQEAFSLCIAGDKLYAYVLYSTPQSFALL